MFIRSLCILIALIGVLLSPAILLAAPKFVPGLNDLPLMPGLAVKSETPVMFDTPGGRIIEVFAAGKISGPRIRRFYLETLPQLGWQASRKTGQNIEFRRDKELLKIEISDDNKGTRVVRFSVVPSGQ
jgi:hypothetical protein